MSEDKYRTHTYGEKRPEWQGEWVMTPAERKRENAAKKGAPEGFNLAASDASGTVALEVLGPKKRTEHDKKMDRRPGDIVQDETEQRELGQKPHHHPESSAKAKEVTLEL